VTSRPLPPAVAPAHDTGASAADPAAVLEAVVLPGLFLTVALLGGFRHGASGMRFVAPPLISLILALLQLAVLARGGLLAPEALMSARRSGLANVSGAVVLVTLTAASAQVFNTLAPDDGLLHVIFNVFFLLLLWNTMAASPDASHLLRSLMVVFGSAFAFKYIVLASLYDPSGGLMKRMVTGLLEGVSLGTIAYRPDSPVTGYVAFLAGLLYVVALALLPGRRFASSVPASTAVTPAVFDAGDRG
jgi:hypothetical protein